MVVVLATIQASKQSCSPTATRMVQAAVSHHQPNSLLLTTPYNQPKSPTNQPTVEIEEKEGREKERVSFLSNARHALAYVFSRVCVRLKSNSRDMFTLQQSRILVNWQVIRQSRVHVIYLSTAEKRRRSLLKLLPKPILGLFMPIQSKSNSHFLLMIRFNSIDGSF